MLITCIFTGTVAKERKKLNVFKIGYRIFQRFALVIFDYILFTSIFSKNETFEKIFLRNADDLYVPPHHFATLKNAFV